jgi:hypothetical protein
MQAPIFGEPAPEVLKSAEISACGRYRYCLVREWDASRYLFSIIMLNPSTADAELDDPTIRRCMAFARREGFGGIRVMNLFAFRATSPDDMKAAADPIGPANDFHLARLLNSAGAPALAAWGAHGDHLDRARQVRAMAAERNARLVCLGKTAGGHPRHPLYIRGDQPLEEF